MNLDRIYEKWKPLTHLYYDPLDPSVARTTACALECESLLLQQEMLSQELRCEDGKLVVPPILHVIFPIIRYVVPELVKEPAADIEALLNARCARVIDALYSTHSISAKDIPAIETQWKERLPAIVGRLRNIIADH